MKSNVSDGFRVGADVGGTFTDIVFLSDRGQVLTRKVPSTPDDYSRGITNGMQQIFHDNNLSGANVVEVVHGCTVATNAVLEHTGALVGLITTKGFRDVLEIRRFRFPEQFNFRWTKPPPLVPRELRLEVNERMDHKGNVLRPLDVEGAKDVIDRLVSKGIESMAVCLLHSYANPAHEQKIKDLIQQKYPDMPVTISSQLIPMMKDYERTSETVVNAYVKPVVIDYLSSLTGSLRRVGVKSPLLLMQSSGGMMSFEAGKAKPICIIECGPAAGVVGSAYVARKLGISNLITLDMGGTTTKASIIENGEISRAPAYEVGAGISVASRLSTGGGYVIRVASIDIAEIGAGGGSKLWIDPGGGLHAGPRSSGAVPGPVCYNIGGEDVTLTDANVVLGYLNPEYLVGGTMRLNAAKARKAVEEQVAKPLKMDTTEAAYGGYEMANSNMIRAIKAVSTERGRDPRDFILFAYGGAGPMHAATLARKLEMKKVIVAPAPGLFSAFGLLFARVEHHLSETFLHRLDEQVVDRANKVWDMIKAGVIADIEAAGYGDVKVTVERYADLRYVGQSTELTIPVPWSPFKKEHVPLLVEAFNEEHLKTYAHERPEEPVDMVTLRLVASISPPADLLPEGIKPIEAGIPTPELPKTRKAYFGKDYGSLDTPVLRIQELSDKPREGPAIIELYDSTCVVPPGCEISLGLWGTIMLDIK